MNGQQIFEATGDIDEELILYTKNYHKKSSQNRMKKWVAVAATLALVIGGAMVFQAMQKEGTIFYEAMQKEDTISCEAIICENLEEMANSYDTNTLISSNPYDYTDNEYYRNIVSLGFEAVPILMDKSEKKQITGVDSYVAAIAVQEITNCDLYEITGVDWETAEQFLELWNETMQHLPKQLKTIAENTEMTTADKRSEFQKYGIFGEAFLHETLVEGKKQFAGEKIEFMYTKKEKEKLISLVKSKKKELKKVVDYVECFLE